MNENLTQKDRIIQFIDKQGISKNKRIYIPFSTRDRKFINYRNSKTFVLLFSTQIEVISF